MHRLRAMITLGLSVASLLWVLAPGITVAAEEQPSAKLPELSAVVYTGGPRDTSDGSVDPRSGRLQLAATDTVVFAGPVSIEIRRVWQSPPHGTGLLGNFWRLNWESRLTHAGPLAMIDEPAGAVMFSLDPKTDRFRTASGEELIFNDDRIIRAKTDGTKDIFDLEGRLTACELRNGNRIQLRYAADGRLSRIEGPYQSFVEFVTDESGRLRRLETSTGDIVQYSYADEPALDTQGKPTVRYACDAAGKLIRVDRPEFGATTIAYDAKGRVNRRTWADGSREQFEYNDAANRVKHFQPDGSVVTLQWTSDGRRHETINARGQKTVVEMGEEGLPARIIGPAGDVTAYRYDRLSRVVETREGADRVTTIEYVGATSFRAAQVGPDGRGQTFEYDDQMNLLAIHLGDQALVEHTYSPSGFVTATKSWGSEEQQFVYNDAGRLAEVRNAAGNRIVMEYDQRGNLVSHVSPTGGKTTWTFDDENRPLIVIDPLGKTTQYEYGPDGHIASVTDAAGGLTRLEYDALGRVVRRVDPDDRATSYEYGRDGRVARLSLPDAEEQAYRYDTRGNIAELRHSSGAIWTFSYDQEGRLVEELGPLGYAKSYGYDSAGRVVETIDALQRKTVYSYDDQGRLLAIRDPLGNEQRLEYRADGQLAGTVDQSGRRLSLEFDKYGRVTGLARGAAPLLTAEFENGRQTKLHGPGNSDVTFEYDAAGRSTSRRYANGETIRYQHNAADQVSVATDGLGRSWNIVYSPSGELAAVTAPTGARTRYAYTPLGQLQYIVDGRGNIRRYEYDGLGRRVREVDPLGRESEIVYGPGGQVAATKSPDGQVTKRKYDLLGRLTEETYPEGPPTRYAYDVVGRVVREERGTLVTRYEYDALDRIVAAHYEPINKSVRYQFDKIGRRSAVEIAGVGRWAYQYDDRDRLIAVEDPQGRVTRHEYDDAGRLTSQALPNGVVVRRTYDGRGRMLTLAASRRVDGAILLDRRYAYDAAGNLARESREGGRELKYEYDAEDRLIGVRAGNRQEAMAYDGVGNVLLADDGAEYDTADQLIRFGAEQFVYDLRGRMTGRRREQAGNGSNYEYDVGGRIRKVTRGGKLVAEYGYDARGRRVWKKVNGATTYFLYDAGNLLVELDAQFSATRIWTPGPELDRPVAVHQAGKISYPLADITGSVVALADLSGQIQSRWDYSPFGSTRSGAAEELPTFGFAGGQYDGETGLYQFRARYYDPALGRFLSCDPLRGPLGNPASLHPYQYAFNNPLRYRDPSGAASGDVSSAILDTAGSVGGSIGYGVMSGATGMINALDAANTAMIQTRDPDYQGLTPDQRSAFGEQLANDYGRPVGDVAGRIAAGVVTAPAHLGTGLGAASVNAEQGWHKAKQGDYVSAAGNFGVATLEAAGDVYVGFKTLQGAKGFVSHVRTLRQPAETLTTAQGNFRDIMGRNPELPFDPNHTRTIRGMTEGSVYAGRLERTTGLGGILNTRSPRPGDVEYIFVGDAAKLFTPHERIGPFSFLKWLGGQNKAGFGDIELVKASLQGTRVVVEEARLLPGVFGGQSAAWAGARLGGRRVLEVGMNGTLGVLTWEGLIAPKLEQTLGRSSGDLSLIGNLVNALGSGPSGTGPKRPLPNVAGLPVGAARAALRDFQLIPAVSRPADPKKGEKPQTVAFQMPSPGTLHPAGGQVVIGIYPPSADAVADDKKMINVPPVIGLPAKAAKSAIEAANLEVALEVGNEAPKTKAAEFTVRSQTPAAGTMAPANSVVVVNLFPKFESPDEPTESTTTTTTTTTTEKPRWFVWRPANWKAGDAEVRMYFEVINEQSAEAKLLIPPQHQAEAQRVLGIPREVPFTAVRRGEPYVVNLKPLADKVSQYIRDNSKKAVGEPGIISAFLGGGGGADLRLDFPKMEAEVVPTTAGLRLRIHGNATLSTDGASQNLPIDVTVVAKPAE